MLTNAFRKELATKGTEVLAVHVGYMDTDMTAGLNVPKSDPADVAHKILAALGEARKD